MYCTFRGLVEIVQVPVQVSMDHAYCFTVTRFLITCQLRRYVGPRTWVALFSNNADTTACGVQIDKGVAT